MTQLWMAGGENPAHHARFVENDVTQVAVNIGSLRRNYWGSFKGLDGGDLVEWIAWTDSIASLDDLLEVIERIGSQPEYVIGPDDWASHENYLPVWNGESMLPVIKSRGLMVTDAVYKSPGKLKQALAARRRDTVIGAITGRPKGLEKLDLAIIESWWNVQSYGETHIWLGTHLRRFRQQLKDECRAQNRSFITALNIDPDLVAADDTDAVIALSLRSWAALGDSIADRAAVLRMVPPGGLSAPADEVGEDGLVTNSAPVAPADPGSALAVVASALPRERHAVLPVMQVDEAPEGSEDGDTVAPIERSVRRCDNCFLATCCTEYDPGFQCAYSIPVVIRTKPQLRATMAALIEMQVQRTFMARFVEEAQGQELSPITGAEMDRTFRLMATMKDIETAGTGFRLSIEGSGSVPVESGPGGVLSKLFGPQVGHNAAALAAPISTNEISDAEVVEPDLEPTPR